MYNIAINSCDKTVCPIDWAWNTKSNRYWVDYDLWVVIRGNGELYSGDKLYSLHPGACFILNPDGEYKAVQDSKNSLVVVHVHFDFLDENNMPIKNSTFPFYRNLFNFDNCVFLLEKLLYKYTSGNKEEAAHWMKSILLEISEQDRLNKLARISSTHGRIINQICNEIQEFPERNYSLKEIAEQYNYSYDYFGRIFKEYTQMSFSGYIINFRLSKAKSLLKNSNYSIMQIASLLGYSDVSFFNKQFKKFNNITPGEYRRR